MAPTAPVSDPAHPSIRDPVDLEHLSYSGITTYASCPRKFYYHYLEKAPQEFVPAALAFGSAFHRAVEAIHQARIEGSPIPTLEMLLQEYDSAWIEATANGLSVNQAKEEDAKSLRVMAERMLSVYREHVITTAEQSRSVQIIGIEHAARFELLPNIPPMEMRLDLLELTADGDLIVSDLKTSRSRWNETKAQECLPQLVLYSSGLMPLLRSLGARAGRRRRFA
jgi:hypothetical protein